MKNLATMNLGGGQLTLYADFGFDIPASSSLCWLNGSLRGE